MATSYPLDLAGTGAASAANAGNAVAGANLPGYLTSMANIGNNIAQETAGQVPADVIALLQQQGAEQNVGTGAGSNAAYLRALGLTSLGLKDTGQKNLESILGKTPGFEVSQDPQFQTSAPLAYEANIQQQIHQWQQQQQQFGVQQQALALKTAKRSQFGGYDSAAAQNEADRAADRVANSRNRLSIW